MRNFKTALLALLVIVLSGLTMTPVQASTVDTATFSGGTGTVTVDDVLYAKQGGELTLTLVTSADTKCVDVAGAFTAHAQSATAKTSWTFSSIAPAGSGSETVTASASPDFNPQNKCTGTTRSLTASYVLDNTGPTIASRVEPLPISTPNQPNAEKWFNVPAHVQFTANDSKSGGATFLPPGDGFTVSGGIHDVSATAVDRLGNSSTATVQVKVDRRAPTITATQVKSGADTTVTFTCVDDFYVPANWNSGIASCLADGTSTNSRTVTGNGTVSATAVDRAGNVSTLEVVVENVDTTAPLLSGAPTTAPNANGWYRNDVTIDWTASDPESAIATQPADTVISTEGEGLTSTQTVTNGAGLSTTATSSPAVKIDKTAPSTTISSATGIWTRDGVVVLEATDALSKVDHTEYALGEGAWQQGSGFTLGEGVHTVHFRSTDKAGNVEATRTAEVYVDQTAPGIRHGFLPDDYAEGSWTNDDVTVQFVCDAGDSGAPLDSCTSDQLVTAEGTHLVTGTASDTAGNEANDVATVRIDQTPPTIDGAPDRAPDHNGWYRLPVTVSFATADQDDLSGLASGPDPVELGEGANQSVTRSATDTAGNNASATVGPFDVDLTAPRLTGDFAAGWHKGDVTVSWTCADDLSGPAGQPDNSPVTGEGDNLSATETCQDVAGNSTTTTVKGIQIDRTAPTTLGSVPAAPASGWYDDVEVTLTAEDNLSGVADTFYTVDGGEKQAYEAPFSFDRQGTHEIVFWSVDNAGNVEKAGEPITLKIDKTAPRTTVVNPISPASGWFVTSGIPFAFTATDGEDRSGVAATYFTIDGGDPIEYGGEQVTRDLSTGQHTVTYWSVDIAGNVEEAQSFDINVDTVAPVITGSRTPANEHGWNNTRVDVTFDCRDEGSGVDGVVGCGPDALLANEGAGQSVTGHTADIAGNTAFSTVDGINIDKTRPTLQGVKPDANGAGWYRGDVVVGWRGDDSLSKIDPATQPDASTITGEGRNLGAGPVTIFDKAGNESLPVSVSGVNIDRGAPSISGGPTRSADSNGWYRSAVTVGFECSDPKLADGTAGSGVATCPDDQVVSGDGANQSVTSGTATDYAGNEQTGLTMDGIDVDSQAPVTTADNQCTIVNAWCVGPTANVVLTATDQDGLSGVDSIHYRVNGGDEQSAPGGSTTVSVPLTGAGAGTVSVWAVDVAGNRETSKSVALKWDNAAPVVTHTVSPAANAEGWNNSDATVHFTATDQDSGSGVDAATVTPDITVSDETTGRQVNGSAADIAGNVGRDSVTVKLDKTAPGITGAVTAGPRGDNGWYTGPVTVGFTCGDDRSGVAACAEDVVLSQNGEGQSASGSARDKADNTSSTTVSGIKIDHEKPSLTAANVNLAGGRYTLGNVPTGTCTATDSFSGLASCVVTVSGGNANGVGTFSYTATATDKAGNRTNISGTYTVVYGWSGYLQPINDTAHQGETASIFKAGSTVPVKFQLKDSAGRLVQSPNAPRWLEPVKGSAMTAPVDESAYPLQADSGTAFRYDATERQYIYNWKTGKAGGNYWRVGVTLDDGQTYYVNIGLR